MTAIAFRLWERHDLITASGRGTCTHHAYCRTCDTITTHPDHDAAQDAADAHQCDPARLSAVQGKGTRRPWTDAELDILRTHSITDTARLTGRTPDAVTKQRSRLGHTGHKKGSHNGSKTHCKRGHELSGDNLRIQPSTGARHCRTCKQLRRQGARP